MTPYELTEQKFSQAKEKATKLKNWYDSERKLKSIFSKSIRVISILLFGLSGLFPLIKVINGVEISNYGYVTIALAGTLLLLDRFFGFSSSWMRYSLVSMEIKKHLEEFEIKWHTEHLKMSSPIEMTGQEAILLLAIVNDYNLRLHELEKQETVAWAAEFQSNLAELQKMTNAKIDMHMSASIQVQIKNSDKYRNIEANLDNLIRKNVDGSAVLFQDVGGGPHEIIIKAFKLSSNQQITTNIIVVAEANKMVSGEIVLPTE